jgi:hypothetical protein
MKKERTSINTDSQKDASKHQYFGKLAFWNNSFKLLLFMKVTVHNNSVAICVTIFLYPYIGMYNICTYKLFYLINYTKNG